MENSIELFDGIGVLMDELSVGDLISLSKRPP
jgi:hypothetical protein